MIVGIDCRLVDLQKNTGISRYTIHLVEFYARKFGEQNLLLFTNDTSFKYKSCQIVSTSLRPYNIFHFLLWSFKVKRYNLDLFHIPFYSGFFLKVNKFKVIVTVHDLMYYKLPNFFESRFLLNLIKKKYFDFIVRKSLSNAQKIFSVSLTTQRDLKELFDIESLHIPEESEMTESRDDSILEKHNLKKGTFFLYCGNNRPHKNLKLLIKTFSSYHLPTLVLVGPNHLSSENILAVGLITDEELNSLYSNAIAFVFPSIYEGFGLPILEALNHNTIVLASDILAFREFNSQNIVYFNPFDQKDLLSKLRFVQKLDFKSENDFFEIYSKNHVHKLMGRAIEELN